MKHLSKIFFILIVLCVSLIFYFIYTDYKKKNPSFSLNKIIDFGEKDVVVDKRLKIVIDAGHGGKDVGAIGYITENKKKIAIYEKNITRAMADAMIKLADTNKYFIVQTRLDDDNTHRHDRIVFAKSIKPNLLISLHCNSFKDKSWNGTEIHICDSTRSLIDTTSIYNSFYPINKGLADTLLTNIHNTFPELKKNKVITRKDRIWMIYAGTFPSVLVEWGYISNKNDIALMLKPEAQDALAKTIWQTIDKHFGF